jgi:hypothetical protein
LGCLMGIGLVGSGVRVGFGMLLPFSLSPIIHPCFSSNLAKSKQRDFRFELQAGHGKR